MRFFTHASLSSLYKKKPRETNKNVKRNKKFKQNGI